MTARFPDPEWFLAGGIDGDTAVTPSMQRLCYFSSGDVLTVPWPPANTVRGNIH
jgi:hypothetical protein